MAREEKSILALMNKILERRYCWEELDDIVDGAESTFNKMWNYFDEEEEKEETAEAEETLGNVLNHFWSEDSRLWFTKHIKETGMLKGFGSKIQVENLKKNIFVATISKLNKKFTEKNIESISVEIYDIEQIFIDNFEGFDWNNHSEDIKNSEIKVEFLNTMKYILEHVNRNLFEEPEDYSHTDKDLEGKEEFNWDWECGINFGEEAIADVSYTLYFKNKRQK